MSSYQSLADGVSLFAVPTKREMQEELRSAWLQLVEVETRESGWNATDYNTAFARFREAAAAYKHLFGKDRPAEPREPNAPVSYGKPIVEML